MTTRRSLWTQAARRKTGSATGSAGRSSREPRCVWCPPPKFCTASRPRQARARRRRDVACTETPTRRAPSRRAQPERRRRGAGLAGRLPPAVGPGAGERGSSLCDGGLIDDTYEDVGIYGVTLCVRGDWTMVWVDAHFRAGGPQMRTASTADLNQSMRRARIIGRFGPMSSRRRTRK